jgi:hypothetical protein
LLVLVALRILVLEEIHIFVLQQLLGVAAESLEIHLSVEPAVHTLVMVEVMVEQEEMEPLVHVFFRCGLREVAALVVTLVMVALADIIVVQVLLVPVVQLVAAAALKDMQVLVVLVEV